VKFSNVMMKESSTMQGVNRRDVLKMGGALLATRATAQPRTPRKVIVVGAGIAGLSCGYDLMQRGHEVVVLEASGRPGGHVRTVYDPLADGLYADVGAEHFYYPGYTLYWKYMQEFGLQHIAYPRRDNMVRFLGGKLYTEQDLHSKANLAQLGLNQREIDFLSERLFWDLVLLYIQPYVDRIRDENDPFSAGLNDLDQMSVSDLLRRDGASAAAIEFAGGNGCALQSIWNAAIKKLRGTPLLSKKLFRLVGGNQRMTDAFAARLKERLRLGCPVVAIEHGASGVKVRYREFGEEKTMEADHLVSCISLVVLRQMPVTPRWSDAKNFIIQEMPYYTRTRVVFQSRTRFWKKDDVSPNWEPPDPTLTELWHMADEVSTPRGVLIGGAEPGVSAKEAEATFHKLYPGKSADIEHAFVHDWSKDPWAQACERISVKPGQLAKFWPRVTEPVGRIHFAGAYCANLSAGQEAALESGQRAANEIDQS
jgi:monoamine oxidase